MRKFRVTVNGETFEVEVEELGGGSQARAQSAPDRAPTPRVAPPPAPPKVMISPPSGPRPAAAAAAPAAQPARPAAGPKPASGKGEVVTAPLPGLIFDVRVSTGQVVKTGDVVVVLEAMKMANEIVAPVDGTVTAVHVNRGATVNLGDPLVTLE